MAVGATTISMAGAALVEERRVENATDVAPPAGSSPTTGPESDNLPRRDLGAPASSEPSSPGESRPSTKPVRRVPEAGSGTFDRAPVPRERAGVTMTYVVEVEENLPISLRTFTSVVNRTLSDPRSWTGGDPSALVQTSGPADLRIVLTTPETTDRLCAPLETRGRVSCRNGENVVINAWRWVNGARAYGSDLAGYRRYVINHEVGHALGNDHQACPEQGALAPVMLQQTLGLDGCRSNPWPQRVDLAQ